MRKVDIIGIGQTRVAEHWDRSLREMAVEASLAALEDAGVEKVDAIYAGNMLSGEFCGQENLGTLLADFLGLVPVEAVKIEAACASGAAALRAGYIAVASGDQDTVLVTGVEKMTDLFTDGVTAGLATAADADYEAAHGLSFVALSALMMRRYMHEYRVGPEHFAPFTVNAHRNAARNPNAMYQEEVTIEEFMASPPVASPIRIMDSAPICDGAAAVVLRRANGRGGQKPVRITASTAATDTIALACRKDILDLAAARLSAEKAYRLSGRRQRDIQIFEVHDAFSIISVLQLEACGFAERGHGIRLASEGAIALGGSIPITTMGGLKGRGHPVGATGMYQVVEICQQIRGEAGANQVRGASVAMAQNIGGSGSVVVTHILEG